MLLFCKHSMRLICVGMHACVWPIMHVCPRIRQIKKRSRKRARAHTHENHYFSYRNLLIVCVSVCGWQLFWIDFLPSMSFVAAAAATVIATSRQAKSYHLNSHCHLQSITRSLTPSVCLFQFPVFHFFGRRDDKNYFVFIQVATCCLNTHAPTHRHTDTLLPGLLLFVMSNHQNPLQLHNALVSR